MMSETVNWRLIRASLQKTDVRCQMTELGRRASGWCRSPLSSVLSPLSSDASPCRDRPGDLDRVAADAVDLVNHVADDAGVVGNDGDHLPDLRFRRRVREIDHAVLLGDVGDDRLRILDDAAEILDVILLAR